MPKNSLVFKTSLQVSSGIRPRFFFILAPPLRHLVKCPVCSRYKVIRESKNFNVDILVCFLLPTLIFFHCQCYHSTSGYYEEISCFQKIYHNHFYNIFGTSRMPCIYGCLEQFFVGLKRCVQK